VAAVEEVVGTSLWSIFTQKAELVGAVVMRTASDASAAALVRETTGGFACTTNATKRFPKLARRASRKQSEGPAAEVVAVGAYAVAETGSIALNEPAPDRGQCFLAERLWILISEREIVPTLDAGMARMHDLVRGGARHPLLMTGPSRTADIERVLTIGVHGPRALIVLVVGDA
jgi:L-lactate dehydrogenase complex protein LldG